MEIKNSSVSATGQGLLLMGVFILPVLVFWPTALSVFGVWIRSDTFAHGIVVFPLALYLLFDRREGLQEVPIRPSVIGFASLFILCLGWYLAVLAKVSVAQQLALALMMSESVMLVFGVAVASRLAFPLLYVVFAVPLGEFLVNPLMIWTAEFTVFALQVTGIPVFQEGMFFKIPSGNFEVAKACSGIRYLIASVSLGVLYANVFLKSTARRLAFIAIAIVIPILANGLRAYGIVMIAHLSGMKLAVGVDHIVYGWVFFGFVMLLMFGIGNRLRAAEERLGYNTGQERVGPRPDADGGMPVPFSGHAVAIAIALAAVTMLVPRLLVSTASPAGPAAAAQTAPLPAGQGDWAGPLPHEDLNWVPVFGGAASRGLGDYSNGRELVSLYLATYAAGNTNAEMVSWENTVYPEAWTAISGARVRVSVDDEQWWVRELLIDRRGVRKRLWYWFESGIIRSGSELMGKVGETLAALPWSRARPRTIVLAINAGDDEQYDRDLLNAFLVTTYSHLQACIADEQEGDDGVSCKTVAMPETEQAIRP